LRDRQASLELLDLDLDVQRLDMVGDLARGHAENAGGLGPLQRGDDAFLFRRDSGLSISTTSEFAPETGLTAAGAACRAARTDRARGPGPGGRAAVGAQHPGRGEGNQSLPALRRTGRDRGGADTCCGRRLAGGYFRGDSRLAERFLTSGGA
jgi:hypothetical protein